MRLERDPASFRDPAGFVFHRDGVLLRQINRSFAATFDDFVASGLYEGLARDGLLVAHEAVDASHALTQDAYAVIKPERVPFVSYPYEWSFGQLKDAALLTLEIQERALGHGFVLRDASAFNVQFLDGCAVWIDTLSFEKWTSGQPWIAYKQFCEHFVAPLALMSYRDIRCQRFLRAYGDGIPVDLAARLLPFRSWFNPGLAFHLHVHAKAIRKYARSVVGEVARGRPVARRTLEDEVTTLRDVVNGLNWRAEGTEWGDYAADDSYAADAMASKHDIVRAYIGRIRPRLVYDLGANTGLYSRLAREYSNLVIAFDADPAAVEINYRRTKTDQDRGLLPLLMDLANPSPPQGWAHSERQSLEERGPADLVLALAIVHHLAISRNVPLTRIAEFLSRLGRLLVIEFVPKEDAQVRQLLLNRADVFPEYTVEGFEAAFTRHFAIDDRQPVRDSRRTLYLMTRR